MYEFFLPFDILPFESAKLTTLDAFNGEDNSKCWESFLGTDIDMPLDFLAREVEFFIEIDGEFHL